MKDDSKMQGYRTPTDEEAAMLAEIADIRVRCGDLVARMERLPMAPPPGFDEALPEGMDQREIALDHRWVYIGKADLQKGFMALTRAVMHPEGF